MEHDIIFPTIGTKIDFQSPNSKYIVKIKHPLNLSDSFKEYADNYFYSAHLVAEELRSPQCRDISKLDTWFFPLAFLYRHSIELLLKAVVFKIIPDSEKPVDVIRKIFHKPQCCLEYIIKNSEYKRSADEIEWLNKYLFSMEKIDSESDTFRYPFHLNGNKNIGYSISFAFEKQTHVDLNEFVSNFEAAYEILKNWYNQSDEPSCKYRTASFSLINQGGSYYNQSVIATYG